MTHIKINSGWGLTAFGDSFTVGQGASAASKSYAARLGVAVGGSLGNQAVSGSGAYQAARNGVLGPQRRQGVVSILAGFNDARTLGLASKAKIVSNLRALIAFNITGNIFAASSLAKSGTWSNLSSTLPMRAQYAGGQGVYAAQAGAYLDFSFKGSAFVIGLISTFNTGNPYPYQDVEYSVDGGPRVLINNTDLTNDAYGHNVALVSGLLYGAHTVRIFANANGKISAVDYVGVPVADPCTLSPILVGEIPYMNSWTYAGMTITPAIVDELNRAISDMVDEFAAYPVRLVKTNNFYNTTTGCGPDGIHPNDVGHDQIYSAFADTLEIW